LPVGKSLSNLSQQKITNSQRFTFESMSKNNQGVLILTSLIVAGLFSVAGSVTWLALQQSSQNTAKFNISPTIQSSSTPSAVSPRNLSEVEIKSDRNVNYGQLREYLQAKDWKKADRETYLRMLDASLVLRLKLGG
jgi:cytoskeletal protein RodZ